MAIEQNTEHLERLDMSPRWTEDGHLTFDTINGEPIDTKTAEAIACFQKATRVQTSLSTGLLYADGNFSPMKIPIDADEAGKLSCMISYSADRHVHVVPENN